jgi:hypothetical protein
MNCGENRRPLSQVAESRLILLANIFSAHGVPIGAESVSLQVAKQNQVTSPAFRLREILFRFLHQLVVNAERRKPGYLERLPDTTRLFCLRRMLNADHGTSKMPPRSYD